jgi:5-methylcytosine-specific restriction endonuclease McrA
VTVRTLVEEAAGIADGQRRRLLQAADQLASGGGPSEEDRRTWLELLADLGRETTDLRELLNGVAPLLGLPGGARERILEYLRLHVGQVVTRHQLAGVAGIDDWARRVRELHIEDGWHIESNETRDDLSPGEYILAAPEPDLMRRDQWRRDHEIRNSGGSGKDRLLACFRAHVGAVITKEELRYVAKTLQEHPRRVRELAEAGWQIDSHYDDPALRPGEYRMSSLERLDAKARQHIKQRHEILQRAEWRCQQDGADPQIDRVRLQVHHIVPVHLGGTNDDENLRVLCDACHAGVHAAERTTVVDELRFPERERTYS